MLCPMLIACLSGCTGTPTINVTPTSTVTPLPPGFVPTYTYQIVKHWPHDTASFTEGLVYADGSLYESDGLNGKSSVRIVDLETGNVKKETDLAAEYFGEGLTILNGKLYQLTWQNQKGFVYDQNSLALLGEFSYIDQGWGLTQDGQSLIMSDGTDTINFLDSQTFKVKKTIQVLDHGTPLVNINELETVKGEIYANIWHTDKIVRIDPADGAILGWIDLSGLRPQATQDDNEAVLNGIAYDAAGDRLFVTGKRWPALFEIRLVEKP